MNRESNSISSHAKPSPRPPLRANSALCVGAPQRLLWAAAALALLWLTIGWALS